LNLSASSGSSAELTQSQDESSIPSELSEMRPRYAVREGSPRRGFGRTDDETGSTANLRATIAKLEAQVASLEQERGSSIAKGVQEREKEIRRELMFEWGKNEAAWKERVRNERLVRMSYERVLLGLGFAPSRIASDLVRVSRPQPLHEDPSLYDTMNVVNLEAGLGGPESRKKGLFSYSMEEIRSGLRVSPPTLDEKMETLSKSEEFFQLKPCTGKKDLLRTLTTHTA
jgi:hypothetical protein